MLQNKLTRAQYLDEVTWTTKSWLGLQKQRISVVLHTAIAEQIVNELACGEGGRVHGAKCLAALAGVAYRRLPLCVPVLVPAPEHAPSLAGTQSVPCPVSFVRGSFVEHLEHLACSRQPHH